MENQHKSDEFIRKLVRKHGTEQLPDNFTDKVMSRIRNRPVIDDTPILSTGTWIAIMLGVAAMIVMIFTVDLPFIDQMFSTKDLEKVSMNIFSAGFFESMTSFFKSLHLSNITVMIIAAAAGLALLERLLRKRFSGMNLIII